jgi:hypothetical protein
MRKPVTFQCFSGPRRGQFEYTMNTIRFRPLIVMLALAALAALAPLLLLDVSFMTQQHWIGLGIH